MLLLLAAVAGWPTPAAELNVTVAADRAFSAEQLEFFERHIRPLLATHCFECHAGENQEGGLRLDSRAAVLAGGDSGPALDLQQPAASLLLDAVRYGDIYQMPPTEQLPAEQVKLLEEWIAQGAPWPPEAAPAIAAAKPAFDLQARKASHWAWRPIVKPATPTDVGAAPASPIDAFLLAKLNDAKLVRAELADRGALLRRTSFDLVGLPPTPAEIHEFENDPSPQTRERIIDRLLASPHFGERWARHWLDVVRYAETLGHESDFPLTEAWRYRDYVIRAFNADLPYDQFVREHIAGDLLEEPRRHPTERFNESILATGFWYLGEAVHAPVDARADQATRLENQVDVFSKAFLGLTVACARCHDHKFDAISTKDYYALAGYLASSHQQVARLDPNGELEAGAARLAELHAAGREAIVSAALFSQLEGELHHADADVHGDPSEQVFADFSGGFEHWFRTGWAFGDAPTKPGDWRVRAAQPAILAPGVAHSGRFAERLPGVLRSPTFTIEKPHLHYRVAGRQSKVRLIVDGYAMDPFTPQLFEGFTFEVDGDEFQWRSQDASRYLGHRAHLEFVDAGAGWLAVNEVRFSENKQPPADNRSKLESMPVPDWALQSEPIAGLTSLAQSMRSIDELLPDPVAAVAIGDGSGEHLRVHIRGNYKTPGELARRRLLEAITADDPPHEMPGSGRLELAERMFREDNPFVARVMVNRIWFHLMGRGLVPTVDNFGALGEPPSHPELLDYLAARFIEEGWSIKRLIREIMLSDAYQRSTVGVPASEIADPQNRLLHRANVRRLEGEAIRDALLCNSGRLDRTLLGPPVPIHLSPFMDGRGKPATSGPLDGAGRRSIYLEVRRNFLAPFLLAFDMPAPATCVGQRNASNVPAQALTLLNDPLVLELCGRWAERIVAEPSSTDGRIRELYLTAFGREPMPAEATAANEFVLQQSAERGTNDNDEQVWADLCHVLVNVKEFIYLR
ncbi:DUF1553 domain-containing protein [Lacipirellula sp.]|uniref:PSD1 and planctomycete cytochrome C domain-containing protein n=1 Tax=Lacipirellula sp. TaxID=2691419 RepID=UPI003D142185